MPSRHSEPSGLLAISSSSGSISQSLCMPGSVRLLFAREAKASTSCHIPHSCGQVTGMGGEYADEALQRVPVSTHSPGMQAIPLCGVYTGSGALQHQP